MTVKSEYLIPGVTSGAELAEYFGKCTDQELMRWAADWISDAVGVWEGEEMSAPETFGKYLHCELRERADKAAP